MLTTTHKIQQVIKDCVAAVEGRHSTKSEAELFQELVGESTGGNGTANGNECDGDDTESMREGDGERIQESKSKSKSKISWTIDTP